MTRPIPKLSPTPLKIHYLLALRTVWTDELWDQTLQYLQASVSTEEAIDMTGLIYADNPADFADSMFKIDLLREFRPYPPSAILAAYDLIRLNRL